MNTKQDHNPGGGRSTAVYHPGDSVGVRSSPPGAPGCRRASDDQSETATLITQAKRGQEEAWERLVTIYGPLVRSVVRRFKVSGPDADDIVQTAWLRIFEHIGELREPRALPGWIATIVRRECIRTVTRAARTVFVDSLAMAEMPSQGHYDVPETSILLVERRNALRAGIAELPDRQRDLVLLLAADPQPSYGEIGARLGMPVGSIGPTRARALERLRHSPAMGKLA